MPIEITTALIGIIAALLGGWAGAAITRKSAKDILKKEQFFAASSKFKSSIIYELTGLFPIAQGWDKKNFHRLYDSIPRINSTAAEFSSFVPSKTDFDKAVNEYNKYCRETKYTDISSEKIYPTMRKEGEIGKQEQFENLVNHLLSFANQNQRHHTTSA